MAKGSDLIRVDRTTCGGFICRFTMLGVPVAREIDRVTGGKNPGIYTIAGSLPGDSLDGLGYAGTLHNKSSCPGPVRFIASMMNDTYEL